MKKSVLLGLVILLIIPVAMAAQTPIKVKTLTYHDVSIYVLKSGEIYYLLESFHKNSANLGEVNVVSNVNQSTVKIKVIVKQDNQQILSEEFDDRKTGSQLVLELYPEGYAPPE